MSLAAPCNWDGVVSLQATNLQSNMIHEVVCMPVQAKCHDCSCAFILTVVENAVTRTIRCKLLQEVSRKI